MSVIVEQMRAADPLASAWVSANAGTGKTKVLTDRLLGLMLLGASPDRILCLTFTKAAAAEMANRLNDRLSKWTMASHENLVADLTNLVGAHPSDELVRRARQLFAAVLDVPGGMKIQTIHAFCQSVLGRFPLEAGVSPHFRLIDERAAADLMSRAQHDVLSSLDSGGGEIAEAVDVVTSFAREEDFADLLANLNSQRSRLARLLRAYGSVNGVIKSVRAVLSVQPGATREIILLDAAGSDGIDVSGLRTVATMMLASGKNDQVSGQKILTWLGLGPAERVASFDEYCSAFFTAAGAPRAKLCGNDVMKAYLPAVDIMYGEVQRLLAVRGALNALVVADSTSALLCLGAAILGEYEDAKRRGALLDYDDLVLKTRDLFKNGVSWVLYKLDGGIDHVLVDEAQDTNPEQWDVVDALAADFFSGLGSSDVKRTLFAVGDVKQSIYSFQRADPAGFERMRKKFAGISAQSGQLWNDVALDTSFRSVEAVLQAVDAVFSHDAARSGVVAPGGVIHHEAFRKWQGGEVILWPLAPAPADESATEWTAPTSYRTRAASDIRLASVIAGQVKSWLSNGEILLSQGRPVRAGDVLVLVRRRTRFVDVLIRELKRLEVPVSGNDRMVLTDQLSVMDLMALGEFLVLPSNDYALACALKSPLLGLDEEQLFTLSYGRTGSLWQSLQNHASNSPVFKAVHETLLDLLHLARVEVRPFDLFSHVLTAQGGRKKMLARLGPDAADPMDEFLGAALNYERDAAPSLQGFLHWLNSSDTQIKRDLEGAARDEVRVMTVHGAKGLQAPIVFLADTAQPPSQFPKILWPAKDGVPLWLPRSEFKETVTEAATLLTKQEQQDEYRRLLYVAMTRAEDRLYICGWETKKGAVDESWFRLCEAGLAGVASSIHVDLTGVSAAGWSGDGLRLACGQTVPAVPKSGPAPNAQISHIPEFMSDMAPMEQGRVKPLMPSKLLDTDPAGLSPLDRTDPRRFRRGLLTHKLLELLPDVAAGDRRDVGKRFLSNPVHALETPVIDSIIDEVMAVLEDPRFAALFGPDSQAEVPVIGEVNGMVVSAKVDRLYVSSDEIMVVDFKSNRPPPVSVEGVNLGYIAQLRAYRDILTRVFPGRVIRCALLWTYGARLMPIEDRVLDAV